MDRNEIPRCEVLTVTPGQEGTEEPDTFTKCDGVIKPGIVMFGEALPKVRVRPDVSRFNFNDC